MSIFRACLCARRTGTNLQSADPASRRWISPQICVCGLKHQVIDCQLNSMCSRTRSGVQKSAACAALRFNLLTVSTMVNIVAHSELLSLNPPARGGWQTRTGTAMWILPYRKTARFVSEAGRFDNHPETVTGSRRVRADSSRPPRSRARCAPCRSCRVRRRRDWSFPSPRIR